ncbi:hypothetical protein [Mesorhizobium sp. WSM2239]|uniref:Uncharacterized protein n=1 Tax=Mesorhizobium sp. WSM2240 TaxID=3228851 RepID=A0AAU8CVC2_9HYPH
MDLRFRRAAWSISARNFAAVRVGVDENLGHPHPEPLTIKGRYI